MIVIISVDSEEICQYAIGHGPGKFLSILYEQPRTKGLPRKAGGHIVILNTMLGQDLTK